MKGGFTVDRSHSNGREVEQFREFWLSLADKDIKTLSHFKDELPMIILNQRKID